MQNTEQDKQAADAVAQVSKCSFNEGSNYSREGQLVVGSYLGMYPEASAVVEASRVTYSGKIKHYCKLVRQLKTEFVLYPAGEMIGLMEDDLTACFKVIEIN